MQGGMFRTRNLWRNHRCLIVVSGRRRSRGSMGCVGALNPADNLNIFKQAGESVCVWGGGGESMITISVEMRFGKHICSIVETICFCYSGDARAASPPFFCSSLRKISDAIRILQPDRSYQHSLNFDFAAPANTRDYGIFSVSRHHDRPPGGGVLFKLHVETLGFLAYADSLEIESSFDSCYSRAVRI